jgi:hypothetical protein
MPAGKGPVIAHLGSAARSEWRPLSDPKRKPVACPLRLVYEFTAYALYLLIGFFSYNCQ